MSISNKKKYAKKKRLVLTGLSPERALVSQSILDTLGHEDTTPSPVKTYEYPDLRRSLDAA
jgi:hypothetical protein